MMCDIQWIDAKGQPTPDEHPIIAYVYREAYTDNTIRSGRVFQMRETRVYGVCWNHRERAKALPHWRIIERRAWTGGDAPTADHMSASPAYRSLVCLIYREQLAYWRAYWGDMPNADTRSIFWRRARFDAFATLYQQ